MIDRFKLLLEQLKLTPSEFADQIGVQRSNISHVLSGRNKPGIDFLEKMLKVFPEIDIAWLITGKTGQHATRSMDKAGDADRNKPEIPAERSAVPAKKTLLPPDEEAVDHIIIVYSNNTFRILNNPEN